MRVLLLQLDGKLPNLALMRIAAHHRALGDDLVFQRAGSEASVQRGLFDTFDRVYASLIFERSRPLAERLKIAFPNAILGGSGWDLALKLEDIGIGTRSLDYSIYPAYPHSMGFTQRGCRFRCSFCIVPRKEGSVTGEGTVVDIWRGEGHPRNLLLLDNDFFGQEHWQERIEEIRTGDFKVCWTQGINARMLTDETAAAIASVRYYDNDFKVRRIYAAWDNQKDEKRLFRGLEALTKYGVKPDQIMVFMLCGYWPGETQADREYRRARLREFGCRPYPMPFHRTPELVGFQRWVVRRCDLSIPWDDWQAANYQPRNLNLMEYDA